MRPPADFDGKAYVGEGPAINSANDEVSLDGLGVAEAKERIAAAAVRPDRATSTASPARIASVHGLSETIVG